MKLSQTISIEQKYGKYLFDKKIRKNNLISKTTIKEEKTISQKNFESDLNEIKEEKKKFIQIIQSFDDPLIPDKVTLENLAFLSDIKSRDSKFTIQLKEELPKIRNKDIKSDFLSNTLNELHDDINLIDLKKNYIIEPLINNYKYKNYDNNNSNQNKTEKEKKDEKGKDKNNEDEDEDEDIMNKRRNIILKSLIYFNKDNIPNGIENFRRRIPDLNKSKFEKDNTFEKNVYSKIEDRIREYLNKYKCEKLSQLRDFENNYIMKIINFQKKSLNYNYIFIKGIIIGLINIINDWLGKEYLRLEDNQVNNDKEDFILDCYEKYKILKKICYFLEKDFSLFIDNFKDNNKLEFKFIDLFSDIFWDYVFRIKDINIYFTKNCGSEKIDEKVNEAMDNITNILYNIDMPYKKMFGDLLNINCIKLENIFLMNYVIKYKKHSNNRNINLVDNKIINDINEKKENNELHKCSSCEMILNNKKDCIKNEDKRQNEVNEDKEYDDNKNIIIDNKEENNNSNNISEDISTNDYNNNINKSYNDLEENKMDLNLGKSYSMDICNNKLNDKDSIEKVYNYILYGENEKKKQKKKHKKRRKHKNSNSIIEEENIEPIDPIVEEYKNYINNIYKNCSGYIKKIKPKINKEWINSLTFSVD